MIDLPDDAERPLAFALVTGGRSQRMGESINKATLPWPLPDGPPLFESQLEKLASIENEGSRIFISCHADQEETFLGSAPLIFDDTADDRGPLAGLAACLRVALIEEREFLVVLAVDLAMMPSALIALLVDERDIMGQRGIVPRLNGKWEPLIAVYPTGLADEAERRLAEGKLALQGFVDWALENGHIAEHAVTAEEADYFQNLNTPADITAAAVRLGSSGFKIEKHSAAGGWGSSEAHDEVAAEEPLEIRVEGRSVAVVMRTSGHDDELAAGFLLTEGVAKGSEDFFEISQCPSVEESDDSESSRGNVIDVLLSGDAKSRDVGKLEQLTRHVFTSSSCGICGKATIDSVFQSFPALAGADSPNLNRDLLLDLPNRLRRAQKNFRRTGGLHASALFDTQTGNLLLVREDVGRHNALDKVVGRALLDGTTPLSNAALLLSGRISFELMQKALAAGIPIVAGISAPSSLAVTFARESGQTLVGFLRDKTFNVYAGGNRLK